MKPLLVLLSVLAVSLFCGRIFAGSYDFDLSGRIAFSVMMIFTALAHFDLGKEWHEKNQLSKGNF